MTLEFLAWNSPPLDFSITPVTVILTNITEIMIIVTMSLLGNVKATMSLLSSLILSICPHYLSK